MLLGDLKEDVPLVIVRPTIVTSTFQEPFPGWVEGIRYTNMCNNKNTHTLLNDFYININIWFLCRTIDSLALGYGKGQITCFLGDPENIIDVVSSNDFLISVQQHSIKS